MSLADWERNGWLIGQPTSAGEIEDLLALAARDLADSATPGLSPDWRLAIAYNAALQLATAALAAEGYRATRDQHHYRVIHSLRETVGTDARTVTAFDAFRRKRHVTGYERSGTVSDADAEAMRRLAIGLQRDVLSWLGSRQRGMSDDDERS